MSETISKSLLKNWRPAIVISVTKAADDIMSVELRPENWIPHMAGQHYELRLPGHHLSRKYSIVSSPHDEARLEFGIQLLPYGEISPRLWKLRPGDQLEIRGPLGAFVWTPDMAGPLVMIAAGSGITPFLSMYNHFRYARPDGEVILIVSAKHSGRVMHYGQYKNTIVARFTTKDGRLDKKFLEKAISAYVHNPNTRCLTCGPSGFTGNIIDILLEMGFDESQIRRETFS